MPKNKSGIFEEIYKIVRLIPAGKVATYGQIAKIAGGCNPRVVGYAMASIKSDMKIPWHRVINSKGEISLRDGEGKSFQRELLESENIKFTDSGKISLKLYQWNATDYIEKNN